MLFAKRLRIWRGPAAQKEAAAELRVPVSTLRKWEYGKQTPNKLAMAYLDSILATPFPLEKYGYKPAHNSPGSVCAPLRAQTDAATPEQIR
jgi:hypothetical protein